MKIVEKSGPIEKLLNELQEHVKEAKRIHVALETIRDVGGVKIELPNLRDLLSDEKQDGKVAAHITTEIKPDLFFGLSNTAAAEKYLKMKGHSVSLVDIYDALIRGGKSFTGDGKKSLYVQLVRATRKFARVGSGSNVSFGLLEFYPHRKKTRVADKDMHEDVEESGSGSDDKEIEKQIVKK